MFSDITGKKNKLTREERIKQALRSPTYKGPDSYKKAYQLAQRNRGKEWDDIPVNER